MALVLGGGTLVSLGTSQFERKDIGIANGRIVWIEDATPPGDHEIVNCSGRLIMPGNVCGHTHLYSALARGMPPPPRPPRNFVDILELVWWRLDRALDMESIRLSALSGALDAVRCGTTTLVDHHASPNAIDGSLDIIAEALDEIGLRGVLCYEVTDRHGRAGSEAGIRENERFARDNRRPRMRGMVGAHAGFTLEDETLTSIAEVASDLGIGVHIHVAEDRADEEDSLRRCGKRTVHRLRDAGALPEGSIAAHCVHVDPGEIDVIDRAGVWVAHNCRSNMNNEVGRAPIQHFGSRTMMGTDGIDENMFEESRNAFFRAREESLDYTAEESLEMLSRGTEFASARFDEVIGRIEPGAVADLVVLDYDPPTPLSPDNFAWHWMFAFSSSMVRSVMVDGAWIVRDRELVNVDEERVRAEARSAAHRLWQRMEAL